MPPKRRGGLFHSVGERMGNEEAKPSSRPSDGRELNNASDVIADSAQ